jgi:NADH-quinone oxidoreductase subunit E
VKDPCIDCDLCLEVCKEGIWPVMLYKYAKYGRYEECRKLGIDLCTDCDDCTRECPLEIPLNKYLRVARILSLYHGNKSGLISVLLEVQASFGYISKDNIRYIAGFFNISEGQIYSVASFYKRLRLLPPGKRHIKVCQGTACHINNAPRLLKEIEKAIGIKEGETSSDREYTLDTVACVGCCALAPVITVNDKTYGKMNNDKVENLFGAGNTKNRE